MCVIEDCVFGLVTLTQSYTSIILSLLVTEKALQMIHHLFMVGRGYINDDLWLDLGAWSVKFTNSTRTHLD